MNDVDYWRNMPVWEEVLLAIILAIMSLTIILLPVVIMSLLDKYAEGWSDENLPRN